MPPFQDLTGQTFARLTVLRRGPHPRRVAWLCQCSCGNEVIVTADNLRDGTTHSCGCWRREASRVRREKPKPQPGERFGRLVLLAWLGGEDTKHPRIRCRCDCGDITEPNWGNVQRGVTQSCGCLHKEQLQARATTHGMSKRREWWIWFGMNDRCRRSTSKSFPDYGGRGITVCARWRESFEAFYADMGPRPSAQHSIDRINPDGHYEPSNCRWATPREQRMNQRRMQR